jgi:hypothetical protein
VIKCVALMRVPATIPRTGLRKLATELKERLERGKAVAQQLLDNPRAIKSA